VLDGYYARMWDQQSAFGRMLDPIADKLLVASCLLMLAADNSKRRSEGQHTSRNTTSINCGAVEVVRYAVLSLFSPSFLIVSSRITNFWILPVMVIGNSGTNSM